jgi:transcription elongation factor GreA
VDVSEAIGPDENVLMTAGGYEERHLELETLRCDARRDLSERLRQAREDGDLADNPALHDLLEEQGQLERRIASLETQLAAAQIVAPSKGGRAGIGSIVRVRDDDGATVEYELVGALESDVGNGRVSIAAPVGQALFGQRTGSQVEVATPRGPVALELLSVRAGRTVRRTAA